MQRAMNLKAGNNQESQPKSWPFKKINKIDKSLSQANEEKMEKIQMTNTRNQRSVIITDHMDIKKWKRNIINHSMPRNMIT